MCILVTGGAGYIGSHTCAELLHAGYEVIVVDNLVNSSLESLKRVQEIAGKSLKFYEADLLDVNGIDQIFLENDIEAVIHFAGLKAVGESTQLPLTYFRNNLSGTIILLEVMQKHGVKTIVYSSSATVYGENEVPFTEGMSLSAANPYGRTKLMVEEILGDLYRSDKAWRICTLRYFNPIGAHESGMIGENPFGTPNNLAPYITQVAVGRLAKLRVFGNDYDTADGTCIRDYIHVVDLALGHIKALEYMRMRSGIEDFNLGTGIGYSVLDVIRAFEQAIGNAVPYEITARRAGDIAKMYANPAKAKQYLGWEAAKTLEEMCADTWRWQQQNPNGFTAK